MAILPSETVRMRLEDLDISIASAARQAGINRVELSQLLNARRERLGFEASVKLARLLDVPLRDLGYQIEEGVRW